MVSQTRNKHKVRKEAQNSAHQKFRQRESERLRKDSKTDPLTRDRLKRLFGQRPPIKTFLVVCEGEKTEPNYFHALRDTWRIPISVEIMKAQGDPLNVVKAAIDRRDEREAPDYDEIWAVFDRDSFIPERIHAAFDKAKDNVVNIAFSNEAFELWFILHYEPRSTGLSRTQYKARLSKFLNRKYEKNSPDMFALLRSHLPEAIRNAMRLSSENEMYAHELIDLNPYTGVHLLIKSMLPDKEQFKNGINMSLEEYQELMAAFL